MLKSLFVRFFEARSTSNSPIQGPTRHDYYQQQHFDVDSSSKLPTISTHEENAIEPTTADESNEVSAELKRLKTRNQGWGLYKVNHSCETPSGLDLEMSAGGKRYVEADSVSSIPTMTTTRANSRQESKGLIEVTTPSTWNEASEMEMGRLFDAAQKLKRSL